MAVKPKLAMLPSGYKASKVYSVLPSDGVGDFDFTRSGSATRINKDGLIETVDSNVPRLNYPLIEGEVSGCPSLLLEPERRNLVQYSEDFTNDAWIGAVVTRIANEVISPDGNQNADKLTASATFAQVQQSYTSIDNSDYTLSVFVKSPTSNEIGLRLSSGANDVRRAFNLSTLSIQSMGGNNQELIDEGIVDFGNGWYRCYITCKADGASAFANIYPKNASDGTLQSVYVWGAQVEQGSYPTSYIPTNGSQVTRSAETCNNAGDASTFNDSEGVLFWDGYIPNDGNEKILQISDGTNTNVVRIFARANGDDVRFQITDGGVNSLSQEIPISSNNYYKISLKYKENDISIWVNGFELYNVNNGSMPSNLNTLEFNSDGGANAFYGNTKQLQYFDTALADTDLEELTSWQSFNEMAESQLYSVY